MRKFSWIVLFLGIISFTLLAQSSEQGNASSAGDDSSLSTSEADTIETESEFIENSTKNSESSESTNLQNKDEFTFGQYQAVNGLENWNYSFDVSGLNKGMYNIVVKGKDKAGNEYIEGPFNVIIDPESDLPLVSITNPVMEMRVGGKSLNIVGTCVDDDAVEMVEVKIDDGDFQKAEGKTYWSYYLDTSEMIDGPHSISVRGTDINGTIGHEVNATFHLDTTNPVNRIVSHNNGSVLNGRVVFEGTVYDLNGVEELGYSTDGGLTYVPLKLAYNKNENHYVFKFAVETTRLNDGPQIYWFQSQDKTGSIGTSAFLFFVDNTKPVIQIFSPLPDEIVNGKFRVSGKVSDMLGIAALSYTIDKNIFEISLIPGNPYFSEVIDLTNDQRKAVPVIFSVTDLPGNRIDEKIVFKLDSQADLPVTTITRPEEAGINSGDLAVTGWVTDDDSVSEILYFLDNEEPKSQPVDFGFSMIMKNISPGKHRLTVQARDENGLLGPESVVQFTQMGPSPITEIIGAGPADGIRDFYTGIELNPFEKNIFSGRVRVYDQLKEAFISIKNGSEEKLSLSNSDGSGYRNFNYNLPSNLDYGINRFQIKLTDIYDRVTLFDNLFYVTNLNAINEPPKITMRKSFSKDKQGRIIITEDQTLEAFFNGAEVKEIVLEPAVENVGISEKNGSISITALKNGESGPLRIKLITEENETFYSEEFSLVVDNDIPELKLEQPDGIQKTGSTMVLKAQVSDSVGISQMGYALAIAENFFPLSFDDQGNIDQEVSLATLNNGPGLIWLRAMDKGNNHKLKALGVVKNNFDFSAEKPQLNFIYPENKSDLSPQKAYVFGYALSDGTIRSMQYIINKDEAKELKTGEPFLIDLNYLKPGTHTVKVLGFDEKGKVRVTKSLSFNLMGAEPEAFLEKIVSREFEKDFYAGASVNAFIGDIKLTGRALSDITTMEYTFNSDKMAKASMGKLDNTWKSFSISVPKDLPYGKNIISLKALDSFGREWKFESFFYHQGFQEPSRIIDEPGIYYNDQRLNSSGQFIFDNSNNEFQLFFNGRPIKSVSLDPPSSLIQLSYKNKGLTVKRIKAGITNPLRIKVVTENDMSFQTEEITFDTDVSAPELNLVYPESNVWLQNTLALKAEIQDDYEVKAIEYSLNKGEDFRALELHVNEETQAVSLDQEIDISDFDDGPLDLLLRLSDKGGNTLEKNIILYKDTRPSEISLVTPPDGESINGIITISGKVKDQGTLALVEFSEDGETFKPLDGLSDFKFNVDFSQNLEDPSTVVIKAVDKSGNESLFEPSLLVDFKTDKPVSQIQVPASGQTLKSDFMISGMVFDDDAVGKIFYRIDEQEFQTLEGSNNFSIPVKLENISDNEHTIEVYAEDINGVVGDKVSSMFKISKAEPISVLESPALESTVRGTIILNGTSSDKNGIKEVYFSLDNGLSFHKMAGTEKWNYNMDTRLLEDGVHRLLFKAIDTADTQGLSSTLISIDNNKPIITLDGPIDGEKVTGFLQVNGRAEDSLALEKLSCEISPINKTEYTEEILNESTGEYESITKEIIPLYYDLSTDGVFTTNLPLENLPPGWYNLRIEARDKANNMSYVTRNFRIQEENQVDRIELIYPMEGQDTAGYFSVEGQVLSKIPAKKVVLQMNGETLETADVNENGYFRFDLEPENIKDGEYDISVQAQLSAEKIFKSEERRITYTREGVWIKFTNFKTGDFVTNRPWLEGEAGYHILPPIDPENQELLKTFQRRQQENRVRKLEISFDNGKSFKNIQGGSRWKYRLQTQDMNDGEARILVRATFGDGTIKTVRKTILNVDETPPQVVMLNPKEGARFNDKIEILGLASDINGLSEVTVTLRKGDKAGYEVPGFIQGAYIEGKGGLGVNIWEIAAGLTFFDQNGKIQVQLGQTPPNQRFGGFTLGVKILLNVFSLPFSVFAGPDWDWLSASIALGANFTYFTNSDDVISFDNGLLLSAALIQLEFPKVRLRDLPYLNTYSVISEISWWIISSDVKPEFKPKFSVGLRLGLL